MESSFNRLFFFFFSYCQDREAVQVQPAQGLQRRLRHRLHQREERQVQQKGGTFLWQIHSRDQTEPGERNGSVADRGQRDGHLTLLWRPSLSWWKPFLVLPPGSSVSGGVMVLGGVEDQSVV